MNSEFLRNLRANKVFLRPEDVNPASFNSYSPPKKFGPPANVEPEKFYFWNEIGPNVLCIICDTHCKSCGEIGAVLGYDGRVRIGFGNGRLEKFEEDQLLIIEKRKIEKANIEVEILEGENAGKKGTIFGYETHYGKGVELGYYLLSVEGKELKIPDVYFLPQTRFRVGNFESFFKEG